MPLLAPVTTATRPAGLGKPRPPVAVGALSGHHPAMTPRLLAAGIAAMGGVLLVVAGGSSFLAHGSRPWHGVLAVGGYAVTAAALCVVGYSLVSRAPVWLRVIVSVALPLLTASVWQVVDQAVHDRVDGWKAASATHLLGGLLVLVVALVGLRGAGADREEAYAPTHR
jgi:hypothetical protein